MSVIAAIQQALQQLGYKNPNPNITPTSPNRHRVDLNGKYFGIWDDQKNTFVD